VKASANALTFGAKLDYAKLRSCANIQLIWRLRPGFQFNMMMVLSETSFQSE